MFIVVNAWILFRARDFTQMQHYFSNLYTSGGSFSLNELMTGNWTSIWFTVPVIFVCTVLFARELAEERQLFERTGTPQWFRLATYYVAIAAILLLGVYQSPPSFIYFQF
jgi:hypothetical protein